jgi:tetratricopeptide (TPR) repeat protein
VAALERFREKHALEPLGPELAFAVNVQLAGTYAAAGLHQEALDLYQGLVRGKAVPHAGRLRANMGSVHFGQGRFSAAIKCFRMALDQLPPSCPRPRAALLRNIGAAFVRMGRYTDAAAAWEAAMQAAPNHQVSSLVGACAGAVRLGTPPPACMHAGCQVPKGCGPLPCPGSSRACWYVCALTTCCPASCVPPLQCGFNLVVCCHALGDKQGMRDAFVGLLQVLREDGRACVR